MRPMIQLYSGKYFDFADPTCEMFDITDIAHALANICRYTGHVRQFYSVAQHCLICSLVAPPGLELAHLLHDAAEAYVGDVNAPLKSLLPDYKVVEERVERKLFETFGVPFEQLALCKEVDMRVLDTERRQLMPNGTEDYWTSHGKYPAYDFHIAPMHPPSAEHYFLRRYFELARDVTFTKSPTAMQ